MKYIKLSSRNKDLLLMGAKTTGSFLEGYYYIEESLYVNDADSLHSFCTWIDDIIGGAGPNNIDTLWLGFKYPEVDTFSKECVEIKNTITRIKSYTA
jgi:hypothetical protein|tara:strand:+ start:444 stop:734 length:291 start_codon:yes stop_codon:yes gene_type:complete